jgi:hypothetical protein
MRAHGVQIHIIAGRAQVALAAALDALRGFAAIGVGWLLQPVRPWSREEEVVLGRKPDREVAQLLGRSLAAVQLRRAQRALTAELSKSAEREQEDFNR